MEQQDLSTGLVAVWCTTAPTVTEQVNALLAAEVSSNCSAVPVADTHPTLYADSVIFFYANEIPQKRNEFGISWLKQFLLIFGSNKDRVHNVIAIGYAREEGEYYCSGGDQDLKTDHVYVFHMLRNEMKELADLHTVQ